MVLPISHFSELRKHCYFLVFLQGNAFVILPNQHIVPSSDGFMTHQISILHLPVYCNAWINYSSNDGTHHCLRTVCTCVRTKIAHCCHPRPSVSLSAKPLFHSISTSISLLDSFLRQYQTNLVYINLIGHRLLSQLFLLV